MPGPNLQPPETVPVHSRANMAQHHQPRLGEQGNTMPLQQTSAAEGKKAKCKGPASLQWLLHHPRSLSFLPVKQHENARHWTRACRLLFKTSTALYGTHTTGGVEPNRWIMVLRKYSHSSACSESRPQICFPSVSTAEGGFAWTFVFKLVLPL